MISILVTTMLAVTVLHCLPQKKVTAPPEKMIDKAYLNQFKGAKGKINKCVFEERVEFYCPYYQADATPPWPKTGNAYKFTECCGDKCCKKDQKQKYDEEKKNKKGWCYDCSPSLASADCLKK